MLCDFDDSLACRYCGYKARRQGTRRNCDKAPPGVAATVGRYATAIARWIAAGRPTRSQEQIDAILAEHCNPSSGPCEHFTGQACKLCGCRINASPEAWRNKLAMGTEACPLDPPKWGASTLPQIEQDSA